MDIIRWYARHENSGELETHDRVLRNSGKLAPKIIKYSLHDSKTGKHLGSGHTIALALHQALNTVSEKEKEAKETKKINVQCLCRE